MKYPFPTIKNINEVLPVIEGLKEFIVAEKEYFTVINYVVAHEETFPIVQSWEDAIKRELRGLKFCNKTGKVASRTLHKFFNVNEREETRFENIDFSKPHKILEKLDGSMIHPVDCDGHIRWSTKMGITNVAMESEAFIAKNPHYNQYARSALEMGFTPIFEWCSNKNRIVINHPEDKLVLLAMRDMVHGDYISYDRMEDFSKSFDVHIPVVHAYDTGNVTIDEIVEIVRKEEDSEGIIIRFDDGHMVKVKSEWYCKLHKVKELISHPRHVVRLILDKKLDDAKSFMMEDDLRKLNKFEKKFNNRIRTLADDIVHDFIHAKEVSNNDRKTFALEHKQDFSPMIVSIIFRLWDRSSVHVNDVRDLVITQVENHLSSNTKYDKIKEEYDLPEIEV